MLLTFSLHVYFWLEYFHGIIYYEILLHGICKVTDQTPEQKPPRS